MTQVEFLAGGNSIDQAIDFICDLVGEFFISEKKAKEYKKNEHILFR